MKTANGGCATAQKARNVPGRNGYRYRQQFGVVVICADERDQQKAYARLQRAGYKKLRVVVV